MIQYLLKHSEFSAIRPLLSPRLLGAVSPIEVLPVVGKIIRDSTDQKSWSTIRSDASRWLKTSESAIQFREDLPKTPSQPLTSEQGEAVLTLYFSQILMQTCWLLDFRADRFHLDPKAGLLWAPKAYYTQPTPDFRSAIIDLYCGFYESDRARLDAGLERMGLTVAGPTILDHLGGDDPSQQRFELATFQRSFAAILESCAKAGIKLPSQFFALGIALLGLYQTLEGIAQPMNARRSFDCALQSVRRAPIHGGDEA